MVRSFSYAAYSGLNQYLAEGSSGTSPELLMRWANYWQNTVSSVFVNAYRATVADKPELLPPPDQAQALFMAYLMEKALYELLYELNNRPTWLRIPIGGILSM